MMRRRRRRMVAVVVVVVVWKRRSLRRTQRCAHVSLHGSRAAVEARTLRCRRISSRRRKRCA
jgi:hypothetical protein